MLLLARGEGEEKGREKREGNRRAGLPAVRCWEEEEEARRNRREKGGRKEDGEVRSFLLLCQLEKPRRRKKSCGTVTFFYLLLLKRGWKGKGGVAEPSQHQRGKTPWFSFLHRLMGDGKREIKRLYFLGGGVVCFVGGGFWLMELAAGRSVSYLHRKKKKRKKRKAEEKVKYGLVEGGKRGSDSCGSPCPSRLLTAERGRKGEGGKKKGKNVGRGSGWPRPGRGKKETRPVGLVLASPRCMHHEDGARGERKGREKRGKKWSLLALHLAFSFGWKGGSEERKPKS